MAYAFSFIKPCMPASRSRPPESEAWLHEIKLDGWRGQLHKSGSLVRLYSKRGNDLSFRFPDIVAAAARMPIGDVVLDGEITAVNADGVPDFEALQRSDKEAMQTFWAFDLLKSGQEDLRARALVERKARLAEVIGTQLNPYLRYVEHFEDGEALLAAGARLGLKALSRKIGLHRIAPAHRMPGSRSIRARGVKPSRSAVDGLKPEPSARRCATMSELSRPRAKRKASLLARSAAWLSRSTMAKKLFGNRAEHGGAGFPA